MRLRNGGQIDLPKLVPSFTSKGFPFDKDSGYSVVSRALDFVVQGQLLDDSFLISAYDIHHNHFKEPKKYFNIPQIVFLDSGGYEVSPYYDSTEPEQGPYKHKPYEEEDYKKVLTSLPIDKPIVISNPDYITEKMEIEDQILHSQKFFNEMPNFTRNFIIKPGFKKKGGPKQEIPFDILIANIGKLGAFDVIGVTEKNLGRNLKIKLKNIARLRAALNREGISNPIHIYGGLDPVLTPLYFFAGAEIFDGASWLRYAYHQGMAIHRYCYGVMRDTNAFMTEEQVEVHAYLDNLLYLVKLSTELRAFASSAKPNFNIFTNHGTIYKEIYKELVSEIPEMDGGA